MFNSSKTVMLYIKRIDILEAVTNVSSFNIYKKNVVLVGTEEIYFFNTPY